MLRICSCLSLRLLGIISATILWANSSLAFMCHHFMYSYVLSLICRITCDSARLLEHASHYVVIGTFDPQVVIRSLIICSNRGYNFLHAQRLIFTIPWGVTLDIIHSFLHLENVRRLLEATCRLLIRILPRQQVLLGTWWSMWRQFHLLLIRQTMKILSTRWSTVWTIILLLYWYRICLVFFRRFRLVNSFALIRQSHWFRICNCNLLNLNSN